RAERAVLRGDAADVEQRLVAACAPVARVRDVLAPRRAEVDGGDLRVAEDLVGVALDELAPAVEDDEPVAALADDVEDVLDDDDRLDLGAQRLDERDELAQLGLDEAGADLVEEQDARLDRERAGELEALEAQQAEVGGG